MQKYYKKIFLNLYFFVALFAHEAQADCDFSNISKNQSYEEDVKKIQSCIKHGKLPPKNWISGGGRGGGNKNIGSIVPTGLASVDSHATLTRDITCGGADQPNFLLEQLKTGGRSDGGAIRSCDTTAKLGSGSIIQGLLDLMSKIRLKPSMTKPPTGAASCVNPESIPNDDSTVDPGYTDEKKGTTSYKYNIYEIDNITKKPIIDEVTGEPKIKETIDTYRVDKKWDDWEGEYVRYKIYFRLNICANVKPPEKPPYPQIIIPPLNKPSFCFDAINKRKC